MREGLRRSLAMYRASALMRPGSPYVWASIATLKARLDELDFEFYGALQRADSLGRWEPPVRRYIDECLKGRDGPRGKDFNMRWVASMVADVFRVLSRGGIFMYPRDAKNKEGRLRLMYEANPMAFIVEQAGGAATDGSKRILEVQPKGLHQRVAVILGSRNEVERVTSYHSK